MSARMICGIGFLVASLAFAQAAREAEKTVAKVAEPPYQVGDLLDDKGYTIERKTQPNLNFRIVNNRIRLYWIDEDRLIKEPGVAKATVRFRGSVRGRDYHRLTRLSNDTGLGSAGIVPPPHRLETVLVVGVDAEGEPVSHFFRYNPTMNPTSKDYGSTSGDE